MFSLLILQSQFDKHSGSINNGKSIYKPENGSITNESIGFSSLDNSIEMLISKRVTPKEKGDNPWDENTVPKGGANSLGMSVYN